MCGGPASGSDWESGLGHRSDNEEALETVSEARGAGKINLNTATAEQLSEVPGVGAKLAARIVEDQQKEGSFRSVSELLNVKDHPLVMRLKR